MDKATKEKAVKQVEFYFSDSNLPKDKFLKEQVANDPEGYMDLRVVMAFQRMRTLLKVITSPDPADVPAPLVAEMAEALKDSTTLQVDPKGQRVKRKDAIADDAEVAKLVDTRSLYARPFPVDITIDQMTALFAKHAPVNCVRLRRHQVSRGFKGSAFVEFGSVEDAEKVAGLSLEYAGAPLTLMPKLKYLEDKKAERKKKNKKDDSDDESNDGLTDGLGGTVGDGANPPPEGSKPVPKKPAAAPAAAPVAGKKREREQPAQDEEEVAADDDSGDEDEAEDEGKDPEYTQGLLLHFKLDTELPELVGPRMITDVFGGKENIKWVELAQDRKSGYLRFHEPAQASKALTEFNERPEDQRTIASIKGSLAQVEGEEELGYHKRAVAQQKARAAAAAAGEAGATGAASAAGTEKQKHELDHMSCKLMVVAVWPCVAVCQAGALGHKLRRPADWRGRVIALGYLRAR